MHSIFIRFEINLLAERGKESACGDKKGHGNFKGTGVVDP